MNVLRRPEEMRAWSADQRRSARSIGLVPTMGALHEGHASLMRAARAQNDAAVVSVFVNPTQFAPHEDFDAYPRTFEADCAMAKAIGIDVVYAPERGDVYPPGFSTYVEVEGLSQRLCGQSRPIFFRGVATVVAKLFNVVRPDRAYFGRKDAQQCVIVKRMTRDLEFGIEIVELPTVREPDGLAMSSRNRYLNAEERRKARCLSRSLFRAEQMMREGERDAAKVVAAVRGGMADVNIDYVELVDAETLDPVDRIAGKVLLAVAAHVGPARLIDNIEFEVDGP